MAQEVRSFAPLIPAGTLATAPLVTSLAMPPRIVRRLRVRVPPGPAGSVGFALTSGGARVVPAGQGTWIVADDEIFDWELVETIESGAWQLTAYNTGRWDHTLYLTFELDPPGRALQSPLFSPLEL